MQEMEIRMGSNGQEEHAISGPEPSPVISVHAPSLAHPQCQLHLYLPLPLYRLFTSHIPLSMNADKKLADATATIMGALGFSRVSDVSGELGLDIRTSVPPPPT